MDPFPTDERGSPDSPSGTGTATRRRTAFFRDRALAGALSGLAFAVYLATMSWTAFPGLPSLSLLDALGWNPNPNVVPPLWGVLARASARWPFLPVSAWMGLFAAIAAAACVYLVVRLMANVGYRRWMVWTKSSQDKERQARRLSGAVAGLYLALSVPFWTAATRSLPETFDLALLLVAVRLFTVYQRTGRVVHLLVFSLLYGIGMVESSTFIVFLPLAMAFAGMEFYRWRCLASWKVHAAFWGGLLAGSGCGVPIHALLLAKSGAFASPVAALVRILQTRFADVVLLRTHPGFLVILFFCLAPGLMLFAMSRRSPWFYEVPQVLVRLAFIGGLTAIFLNASFSPWRLLGFQYLMVTPYLLFAVCMGYMAGEFWILGEPPPPRSSRTQRTLRRTSAVFAILLPLAIAAGGVWNGREANGRHGAFVATAIQEILGRIGGRDVLYFAGPIDEPLRLAIGERNMKLRTISATRTESPTYLRHLASQFAEEPLRMALDQGDFARFHRAWMLSDGAISRTAAVDLPDAFQAFACPVPDGLVYRLESSWDDVDWSALLTSQERVWRWLSGMAEHPLPRNSLARSHQEWLCALGSKTANNLGVLLMDRGDREGAGRAFRASRRMQPANLAALMNLLELSGVEEGPETAALEEEWNRRQEDLRTERWRLGGLYGYLWNPAVWVGRGFPWALSGVPSRSGAAANGGADAGELDLLAQWVDQAYLRWGRPVSEEWVFRAQLGRNDRDTASLMELARLALRRKDPETAEVYMSEAQAVGLPETEIRFDRAIAAAVRGDRKQAVAMLKAIERENPGDARAWSALLRLADETDPIRAQALRALKNHPPGHVEVHLVLAWEHLLNHRWKEAETELDRVVQLDPRHRQAWELMVVLGQLKGKRRLIEGGTRTLIAEDAHHPLAYVRHALGIGRRGRSDEAEVVLADALRGGRNPDLLNTLAYMKMQNGRDESEIRPLLDEAIAKRPFHPVYRCSRIELELREGRLDQAWKELQVLRRSMPEYMPAALLAARILAAQGNFFGVRRMLDTLEGWRKSAQTPEQRNMLEEIIGQMEAQP